MENLTIGSKRTICRTCSHAAVTRCGYLVKHICTASGELRPYDCLKCNQYEMISNRQKKRDAAAKIAYKIYKRFLKRGMSNQQAIDAARFDESVMVSERTMRNYIKLMEEQ